MTRNEEDQGIDVLLTCPADGLRLFQSMIPTGLVSIGTVLQNAGYRVALIDFNHYTKDYRRHLCRLRPKIIGIGGTTPSRMGSFLTARLSKQVLPDTPVVYGGINATFTAQEVLASIPEIDYILKGEAELSFPALCNALLKQPAVSPLSIPGLCYRNGSQVIQNRPQRIQDLSVLPVPNRGLLGDFYHLDMEFIGGRGEYIMTSRGCPAACNFCSASRMFPGGVRLRPMDAIMSEIENLCTGKTPAGLKLFDSTFTADRNHVEDFCTHIKKMHIPWECEIRADTVDVDLLRRMKESGCYYINIGMETSSPKHLTRIAKGITPKQVLDVLATCKILGLRSKVFFTFGHIDQTFRECLDDIHFIDRNRENIDFFAVTVGMRIYPGTRLERDCKEKGILGKKFSWVKSIRKPGNFFVFEPGDVPVLFQKGLGPLKLMTILFILLKKKLICTEPFLWRMVRENCRGVAASILLTINHTKHLIERMMDRRWTGSAWAGTVYAKKKPRKE